MSTHNIYIRQEIRKILSGYPLLSVAMRLNKLSHTTYWKILISILGMTMRLRYSYRKMVELFANSGYPYQMPHSENVASDLDLHCLLITILGVSRLQWVKYR